MYLLRVLERTPQHEHRTGVTVIGATGSILANGTPELRHRENHHVFHAIPQICHERRNGLRKVGEALRELPVRRALIDVGIPAADIRKRHFKSDVCLDELGDLREPLSKG